MTEMMIFRAGLVLAALVFACSAGVFLRLREPGLPRLEHFLRNRVAGAILAVLALAWCIPQVRAVAWDALAPWLWPLAAVAATLAYFYLDNVFARAVAGLLIMGAYTFLQVSFASRLATGVWGALAAWSWGSVGILIAAKPCFLRDFFRLTARSALWRGIAFAATALSALLTVLAAVLAGKA